jgi:NADPH2:quinone reductase
VQLARARGLKVLATAGSEAGRALVLAQGAQAVFDHGATDYVEKILKETDRRGVDIILEMLANRNLGKDLTMLAARGRVIVIGSRGRVELDPRDTMIRDADIRGMVLNNASQAELARIHAALGAGLENGSLRPVIAQELPLTEAETAHITVMLPGAAGKIVLIP